MKTIDIITDLKLYAKTDDKAILSKLLDTLEAEYRREETKKQGGNIALKRLRIAEKILKGNQKDEVRPNLHKCFMVEINGEKMQVFGTPYYLIALKEAYKVQAETWGDDEQTDFKNSMQKIFNKGNYKYTSIDFDLTEIKKQYAEWKAEQKQKPAKMRDDKCVLRIGNLSNIGYNAEYFMNCVEALGSDTVFLQNGNSSGISFFESENGIALLCGVRI